MMTTNDSIESRRAWLKERQGGIGGSDAAVLAGLGQYGKTALDVYADKVLDDVDLRDGDSASEWGLALEPGLVRLIAKEVGIAAYDHLGTTCIVDPERPWVRCSPDGLAIDGGPVISLKTTVSYLVGEQGWGEPGTDAARLDAWAQAMYEMGVTGRAEAFVGCAILDQRKLLIYHVRRDDEVIENLREVARAFWFDHVVPRVPPHVDGEALARAGAALRRLHPVEGGEALDADGRMILMAKEYAELGQRMGKLKAQREAIGSSIKLVLGDAPGAQWGDLKGKSRGLFCRENSVRWTSSKGAPAYKRVVERLVAEAGADAAIVKKIIDEETPRARKLTTYIKGDIADPKEFTE